VRLSPLGTSATAWPIVPASEDRWWWWWWMWSSRWNENWQGKSEYSEKSNSATLSTTNPTLPDPGSNPDCRGRKSATNRLSYGAASLLLATSDTCVFLFWYPETTTDLIPRFISDRWTRLAKAPPSENHRIRWSWHILTQQDILFFGLFYWCLCTERCTAMLKGMTTGVRVITNCEMKWTIVTLSSCERERENSECQLSDTQHIYYTDIALIFAGAPIKKTDWSLRNVLRHT
jgi:hypothetical protein